MVTQTKNEYTNIQVSLRNRERLIKLGAKNDSYNDILDRILDRIDKLNSQ
jgi:hypothetical protein